MNALAAAKREASASSSSIRIKPSRKGLLHRKLGVPQGQPIPASALKKAKRSSSASLRKEATFASNSKSWG